VLALVLLGMLMSAFPLVTFAEGRDSVFDPLLRTRFPGVLQRIGVCYGLAALMFLFARTATQRLVLVVLLFGYWWVITQLPVPGTEGPPNLDDPMGTLQGHLDRLVFGTHIYVKGKYDPEGLLSTMPALATCLFGVEAGRVLGSARAPIGKVKLLLAAGAALMALGCAWSFLLPLNKPLWTSSYAVWTAGIAFVLLGTFVGAFELRGWKRLAHPLQVYGVNALLVFVGSGLLAKSLRLVTVTSDGKPMALPKWFFDAALASWAEPKVASLLFALLWVSGWYLVLAVLFRRGIVWKV
jgi:predicted acyltransferase